jgi:hypothetical protein
MRFEDKAETRASAGDPTFLAELDRRILEMRRLLEAMAPMSASSALRTLRERFPDASLGERVRALKDMAH